MRLAAPEAVLAFLGVIAAAAAFVGVVFLANALIAPKRPGGMKDDPFECGLEPAGPAWNPPRLRFAAIALLFVLFDAEAVLLFAVVSRLRGSISAAIEIGAFVLFLGFGLAYAWKKGALEWHS